MIRSHRWLTASLLCALFLTAGCVSDDDPAGPVENEETNQSDRPFSTSAMEPFSTDDEFLAYMEEWAAENEANRGSDYNGMDYADDGMAAPEADAADSAPDNEDITNNQEEGVDEGGIVKNVGDFLVVLRRGALYSVDVAESGELNQIDALRVAASEDLNQGVWYDEMLVRGDQIYVIGYRYGAHLENDPQADYSSWIYGATEVSSFHIDHDGELTRGSSTYIESTDYFSGSNYASRMVDGKLIFYMPYTMNFSGQDSAMPELPTFLHHKEGNTFTAGDPIFGPTDIIKPLEMPSWPTFHTVIQCELPDDLSIDCSARSLLSDWGRQFYVSRDRIYLWSQDHVFALSQTTDEVAAHAVRGNPRDQFAFREVGETLHVGTMRQLEEDELTEEQLAELEYSWQHPMVLELLSLPLADFTSSGGQELDGKTTLVAEDIGWGLINRHVGDWYLVGDLDELIAHHIADGETTTFPLGGRANRIESAPGVGALIVYSEYNESTEQQELNLDSLLLGDNAELVSGTILEGMAQGEHRSHGFFFRPDAEGGLFGLPILSSGSGWGWWGSGVSNIGFFRAQTDGELSFIGAVSSSDDAEGQCETSCVDWYGNTRPIFLFGRVFALMGSELVEVDPAAGSVDDIGDRVLLTIGE